MGEDKSSTVPALELKGGAGEVGGDMVLWEKGSRQQSSIVNSPGVTPLFS